VTAQRSLVALPKTDLHIHLEGSMRAATVAELADRTGRLSPVDPREGWSFASFGDFLAQYDAASACLTELDDFRRVARELCDDLAAAASRTQRSPSPSSTTRCGSATGAGPSKACSTVSETAPACTT
jgi:adenosine deaminase